MATSSGNSLTASVALSGNMLSTGVLSAVLLVSSPDLDLQGPVLIPLTGPPARVLCGWLVSQILEKAQLTRSPLQAGSYPSHPVQGSVPFLRSRLKTYPKLLFTHV